MNETQRPALTRTVVTTRHRAYEPHGAPVKKVGAAMLTMSGWGIVTSSEKKLISGGGVRASVLYTFVRPPETDEEWAAIARADAREARKRQLREAEDAKGNWEYR